MRSSNPASILLRASSSISPASLAACWAVILPSEPRKVCAVARDRRTVASPRLRSRSRSDKFGGAFAKSSATRRKQFLVAFELFQQSFAAENSKSDRRRRAQSISDARARSRPAARSLPAASPSRPASRHNHPFPPPDSARDRPPPRAPSWPRSACAACRRTPPHGCARSRPGRPFPASAHPSRSDRNVAAARSRPLPGHWWRAKFGAPVSRECRPRRSDSPRCRPPPEFAAPPSARWRARLRRGATSTAVAASKPAVK